MSTPHFDLAKAISAITPLTGLDSWPKWKGDIKLLLGLHGTWKYVDGTLKLPTELAELQKVNDQLALASWCISMTCDQTNCDHIEDIEGAIEKFTALKALYEGDTPAKRMTLCRKLYHAHHDPSLPVIEFVNSVRNIVSNLTAIKHAPKPDEICDIILMNLDPSFEVIQTLLSAQDKDGENEWTIEIEMEPSVFVPRATFSRVNEGRRRNIDNGKLLLFAA
ncbi:hypothetical protein CPB86DRAFT_801416 [Serendipita vermifera]|nr:hypothetical protein CPB86DRAFT_801416 [Serendipita vermifera]